MSGLARDAPEVTMPRGPLPKPDARRRNAETIQSTVLPAEGRKGRAPSCPYKLGKPGRAWWNWAWKLPQATRWDAGALYVIARRAQLEDELASLEVFENFDLAELLSYADEKEAAERLEWLLAKLKARAGNSTTVMREMRELDNRLGLNPKALAELRWSVGDVAEAKKPKAATVTQLRAV